MSGHHPSGARPIGTGNKGLADGLRHERGWNVFDDSAPLPAAVIVQPVLEHNSAAMAAYCLGAGVSLAPHGKTTMSPELFALQLRDGAWAITAANAHQARAMLDSGVPRVLIALALPCPWRQQEV